MLHRFGFKHKNLKPSNIFITESGCIKLSSHCIGYDYIPTKYEHTSKIKKLFACGNYSAKTNVSPYRAPEIKPGKSSNYTCSSDMFSVGGILYYVCAHKDPYS